MAVTESFAVRVAALLGSLCLAACDGTGDSDTAADESDPSGESDESGEPEESSESEDEGVSLDPAQAEAWQLDRFVTEVQPTLDALCSGCHASVGAQVGLVLGPSSAISSDEILLGIVERQANAAPLAIVEPGDPDNSWLVRKITGDFDGITCNGGCGGPMPPAGQQVSAEELTALIDWISAMEPLP